MLLPNRRHNPSHAAAELFKPYVFTREHAADTYLEALDLVLLVVRKQNLFVGHAVEGRPCLVHARVVRRNVRDVRTLQQPGIELAVRIRSRGRGEVVGVGKKAGEHQPRLRPGGILAHLFVHRGDDRTGGADGKGIIQQRVRRRHGAGTVVVNNMQDAGLRHAVHCLRILAVVGHDHVKACCVLQHRRGLDPRFLKDVQGFTDHLARHAGLCVDSQALQQVGIGDGRTHGVAVWAFVPHDKNPVAIIHAGDDGTKGRGIDDTLIAFFRARDERGRSAAAYREQGGKYEKSLQIESHFLNDCDVMPGRGQVFVKEVTYR